MLDTFEVTQIVSALRPIFLQKQVLLLTVAEITILASHQDGTFHGIARDKMTEEAYRKLKLWSFDSLESIHTIRGILFSTQVMADRQTMKFCTPRNFYDPGHFLFFDFDLSTKKVKIIDSLFSSFSSSRYFCENTIRTFFSYLLRVLSFSSETKLSKLRGFKPSVSLTRNSTPQISLECGSISALNLILSLNNSHDYLKKYTFTDYSKCVKNIKPLLCHILYSQTIPFDSINEE